LPQTTINKAINDLRKAMTHWPNGKYAYVY